MEAILARGSLIGIECEQLHLGPFEGPLQEAVGFGFPGGELCGGGLRTGVGIAARSGACAAGSEPGGKGQGEQNRKGAHGSSNAGERSVVGNLEEGTGDAPRGSLRPARRNPMVAGMDALLGMARVIDGLNRALARLTAWLLLAMVVLGAGNALLRYADARLQTQLSSNAFLELQWYLFSLVFLLASPYALHCGAHVRVDVLYGQVSNRRRWWTDLLGGLCLLLPFTAFSVWVCTQSAINSIEVWEQSPDPSGLPRWPIKAMVPIAFALLGAQSLSESVKRIALLLGRDPHSVGLAPNSNELHEQASAESQS